MYIPMLGRKNRADVAGQPLAKLLWPCAVLGGRCMFLGVTCSPPHWVMHSLTSPLSKCEQFSRLQVWLSYKLCQGQKGSCTISITCDWQNKWSIHLERPRSWPSSLTNSAFAAYTLSLAPSYWSQGYWAQEHKIWAQIKKVQAMGRVTSWKSVT